jgi:hypothetical protein
VVRECLTEKVGGTLEYMALRGMFLGVSLLTKISY